MSNKKKNEELAKQKKQSWKVWAFVIGLNVAGLLGAIYLQSKGIDVFAFRGGS